MYYKKVTDAVLASDQRRVIEQAKFTYSSLEKAKKIEDQGKNK